MAYGFLQANVALGNDIYVIIYVCDGVGYNVCYGVGYNTPHKWAGEVYLDNLNHVKAGACCCPDKEGVFIPQPVFCCRGSGGLT